MTESHMPTISSVACWLAIIASFVLSFSTWLALGSLAGFGALAVAMPFCVDGYTVTALTTWLLPGVSDRLARFARTNLYSVGLLGMLAQGSYHAWLAATTPGASQGKTALAFAVGLFPMAIATLAVHLKARAVREAELQSAPALPAEPTTAWATAERAEWPAPPPPALAQPAPELPDRPATSAAQSTTPHSQPVTSAAWQPAVPPTSTVPAKPRPAQGPPQPAKLSLVTPADKQRARRKVEESGSGPLTKGAPSIDDVRPLVNAGLGRNTIAERLGIGTGVARRLIDAVNAENADRPAVTS